MIPNAVSHLLKKPLDRLTSLRIIPEQKINCQHRIKPFSFQSFIEACTGPSSSAVTSIRIQMDNSHYPKNTIHIINRTIFQKNKLLSLLFSPAYVKFCFLCCCMGNQLTDRQFWTNYWESKPDLAIQINKHYLFHQQLEEIVKTNNVQTAIELGGFPGYYSIFLHKYLGVKTTLFDYFIHADILKKVLNKNGSGSK
jgi:hypothetical protein